MSATTHRQVGASPSLRCNGAAALNSVTLKWLKAELVLLGMEMQRSYHVVGTKPQRLLQVIWEAPGVRFAPEGAFVLCLRQGRGMQSALCRITPCSSKTASGLFVHSQEDVLMLTSGSSLSSRFFWGAISVSSSITQHGEFRDALCQHYSVCDVGTFFLPFKLGTENEI